MNKRTLIGNFLCTLSLLAVTTKPAFAETPQPAQMGEKLYGESSYAAGETENVPNSDFLDFIDMKVEIRNAERASQVMVEQWDEFEKIPYTFEVDNFQQGYFVANLDTECATTLTMLSVVDNNICRSNAIFIPAPLNQEQAVTFDVEKECVVISGLSYYDTLYGMIFYAITSRSLSSEAATGEVSTNHSVDISHLSPGDYILAVRKEGRILGRTKFTK